MNTFLTVPITVREQIYHELLTYTPSTINFQLPIGSAPSERYFPKAASSSPLCRLFTLNRQIHAEVLQFLRSQLCVVLKSNHSRFTGSIFDERALRVPLISQLQSRDGSVKKDFSKFPVAMEWDICVFQNGLEAESASWFLIPATSLPTLIQNAEKRVVWATNSSLHFKLLDTFSYSHERALEILIHPHLDVPPFRRKFIIVSTNDAITSSLTEKLKKHLMEECSADYYLCILESFQKRWSNRNSEDVARQCTMACKYARMVYDYRFDCIRNNTEEPFDDWGDDAVLRLWLLTCESAAHLIQALCRLAGTSVPKGLELADASDGVALLQKARKVAEEMISLLSDKPTCVREESLNSDTIQTRVCRDKYLVSYRAHTVCRALGDVDAGMGYLEDAIKYAFGEPENPVEKLKELEAERGRDNREAGTRVVRWKS